MEDQAKTASTDEYKGPKPWAELEDAGRIERLREQIKLLQNQIRQLTTLQNNFNEHSHDKDGRCVIVTPARMSGYGNGGLTAGMLASKVGGEYF